ncbi:uncharacterized protein ACLA_098460 [Aspergillus clavatus NRRL 1]|uniref:Uncharacterized protein n=1 Tax=Aspergillus clavatus (strain ATCC 1007 / CBS 513.65 / DSM 816 / NCTC 3887 / NRRL 1 / QM 1276 / 107) TaxID=344612 RepID=A1CMW7_ASPCL|nr:uncharacterized protein ACLA_098460 [Aspergillus clavatus NRRL 1]EAW08904.1 hypothetical protein ACLA_098460 [Aspergillus clavatus NRRL 1]
MSQSRRISDFFKRPHFALTDQETRADKTSATPTVAPQLSSPLTEPPSSSLVNSDSPQTLDDSASQLTQSLLLSVQDNSSNPTFQQSFQSSAGDPSPGASFNQSQRVVKNGKEVVISSDGEDTDSVASFELPEDPFLQFLKPGAAAAKQTKEDEKDINDSGMSLRSQSSKDTDTQKWSYSKPPKSSVTHYKFSLDDLVTQAVDDKETEAVITRIKATRKNADGSRSDVAQNKKVDEGVLTSALGDKDDELGLQRLLDAVRRTEAFELEKFWSFFDHETKSMPVLEFPRDSIAPGTYLAVLREPESRERAFNSGVLEFALSRAYLPDDLVSWIFHSVPSEPRESLRQAYCRVFKYATADRVRFLIRPDDIDSLFQRLGAKPKALAISESALPEPAPQDSHSRETPQHRACLLSVLELLRGATELFADDTRERILNVLFRLALDISLTSNATVCSELERTITATLESVPDDTADDLMHRVCIMVYNTFKDPVFQGRLLRHILPTSEWMAALRHRLALAFLINDPRSLTETSDVLRDLRRVIDLLRDQKFNTKRYRGKGHPEYDYSELNAITTLLNIVIDSGWSGMSFPTKDAEKEFNSEVDRLDSRITKIFVSIADSGASHLKRTLAKEALEMLHYRIVYSVRSRPPPKKMLFGEFVDKQGHQQTRLNYIKKRGEHDTKDTDIPIRTHEHLP